MKTETVKAAHETRDLKELLTKHIKYPKSGGEMCRCSRSDRKRPMVIYSKDKVCHVYQVESQCSETNCNSVFLVNLACLLLCFTLLLCFVVLFCAVLCFVVQKNSLYCLVLCCVGLYCVVLLYCLFT